MNDTLYSEVRSPQVPPRAVERRELLLSAMRAERGTARTAYAWSRHSGSPLSGTTRSPETVEKDIKALAAVKLVRVVGRLHSVRLWAAP